MEHLVFKIRPFHKTGTFGIIQGGLLTFSENTLYAQQSEKWLFPCVEAGHQPCDFRRIFTIAYWRCIVNQKIDRILSDGIELFKRGSYGKSNQ
jgi:hypothetical protein